MLHWINSEFIVTVKKVADQECESTDEQMIDSIDAGDRATCILYTTCRIPRLPVLLWSLLVNVLMKVFYYVLQSYRAALVDVHPLDICSLEKDEVIRGTDAINAL